MTTQGDGDREADELKASIDAAAGPEVRYLGDVQRLFYKPGDVIVLSIDDMISDATAERIAAVVKSYFGADVSCLVLGAGMRIGVLSEEKP